MYDKELLSDLLFDIIEATTKVENRCCNINSSDRSVLIHYPQIPWKNIVGIRDILSHNYFDLNAQTVFGICQDNIKELKRVLIKIKEDTE